MKKLNLKHIFNYIFYMAYIKDEKRWAGSPVLAGILDVSLTVNLYLFIISFVLVIMGFDLYEEKNILIPVVLAIGTIVAFINYLIYGYKKKYLKIIEKYKNEDSETRKKNRLIVTLFIIFSLLVMAVLFVVSVILYRQRHGIVGHF
ncbi:MAG: hypothetical protein GXO50_04660 [Chlorobi bacterium]|nr:hypothetical protein [Chlorobiota bacterium]